MRGSAAAACVLMTVATVAGAAAAASYKPPVAVLPFKNLNAEAATDWLKLGVAETMLSDLKKAKVTVVERDQIDKALSELILKGGEAPSEDGQAVQVGKLVGAKTVVVGSFQAAGKQLRFNARFVEVETGVILDTAKTTGPIDQVFSLQDQVVDKLLGVEAAKAARPARKQGTKTVEAYKLYAMSLGTSSDAERVGLLKKSLELDPSFVYAADELAALQKRLTEYVRVRDQWAEDEEVAIWKLLQDPAVDAQTKSLQAGMLLGRKTGSRRLMAQIADAKRIVAMNLPEPPRGVVSATETSLFMIFSAYQQLQKPDLAMQAGEELMRRYPHGVWFSGVQTHMQLLVDARRRLETEGRPATEKRLAEIDAELAALPERGDYGRLSEERKKEMRRSIELEKCFFGVNLDPERAAIECRAFVEAWSSSNDSSARGVLRTARYHEIRALFYAGRWEELIPKARAFVAENPDDELGKSVRSDLERQWPVDVVP